MEIIFLGTSCMVPTKERNHQAIFITYRDEGILVDCGEGTQRQFSYANIKHTKITKILISHWHGDHVLGLPGLLQTLSANNYECVLEIYGPKGTKNSFEHMFEAFSFSLGFEIKITELENTVLEFKDLIIESKKLEHGVPCLGYSIKEKDRRRIKTTAIKKIGLPDGPLLGKLQNNQEVEWKGKKISPNNTTYVVPGKKVAIVLDTLLCNSAYSLAQDADLLISEAVYDSNLKQKAEEYKHLTAQQAAGIASKANVKKLILTHFSQRYKSTAELLEEAKSVFTNTFLAHDLMKVKL